MITDNAHIDNLIARYLTGDTDLKDQIELDDWISASPENRKYFDDIQHIFFRSPSAFKYKKIDAQKAWDLMQEKMHKKKDINDLSKSGIFISRRLWISVAASAAILSGITFFILRDHVSRQNEGAIIIASGNIPVEKPLPDKSMVTLNRNSTIKYNFNKVKKQKELYLNGEAFIEVEHKKGKPLVVIAGNTFITDIGTSFNVKAYENSRNIEVFVKSGQVRFFTSTDKGIVLNEGEQGIYSKDTGTFSIKEESQNVIAYKTGNFVFKGIKLSDVVALLNDVYQTNIEFQYPGPADCTITVSFSNESIETILGIITETLDLTYTKTDNGYVINGEKCQSR